MTAHDGRNPEPGQNLDVCPKCGGPADMGNDRCIPPSPYNCSKCQDADNDETFGPVNLNDEVPDVLPATDHEKVTAPFITHCSFCGAEPDPGQLVVGPMVSICKKCAGVAVGESPLERVLAIEGGAMVWTGAADIHGTEEAHCVRCVEPGRIFIAPTPQAAAAKALKELKATTI